MNTEQREETEPTASGQWEAASSGPSIILVIAVMAAVAAWTFLATGHLGFNPTDDGYVLAQARRVLNGQLPHIDIISPRPLGSAYIHTINFALPMPVLEASRLFTSVEVAGYSFLAAALIYGRRKWGISRLAGAAGSALINVHTFPLMSWQTIDGLLLISAGFLLVERGISKANRLSTNSGFLLLGLSVLVKQSFLPAPFVGVVLLFLRSSGTFSTRVKRVAVAGCFVTISPALYVLTVYLSGGMSEMFRQLSFAARSVWGQSLIEIFRNKPQRPGSILYLLGFLALLVTLWGIINERRTSSEQPRTKFLLITQILLTATFGLYALMPTLVQELATAKTWGILAFWATCLFLLFTVATRRADMPAGLLIAMSWMASISLGYPFPNLTAGSLLLLLVARGVTWLPPQVASSRSARRSIAVIAVTVLVILAADSLRVRRESPYFDHSANELTAELENLSPEWGRIKTNPITYRYLARLRTCVTMFPASSVAVFPDNAATYVALHLNNPFPTDWLMTPTGTWPGEVGGSEARLLAEAKRIGERGSFLILFQLFSGYELATRKELPEATPASQPFSYGNNPLAARMMQAVGGETITCGSFIGKYSA